MERPRQTSRQTAWWNLTGWECCAVCAVRFDPEIVVHCVSCDQKLCPLCRVAAGRAPARCAGCAAEEA